MIRRGSSTRIWIVLAVLLAASGVYWAGRTMRGTTVESLEVRFLAVGQGDAILIREGVHAILVDTGPTPFGRGNVVPRLTRLGVRNLDAVIVTHPDRDHIGGLASVWKRFPRARILMNGEFRNHELIPSILNEVGKAPDQIEWLDEDRELGWGRSKLRIFLPPPSFGVSNKGSLFVHLEHGPARAVFTGDAPMPTEEAMLRRFDFRAEVMAAGHHGSASSGSPAWLAAVKPRWVVASCGRDNPYGHPSVDVQIRTEKVGAELLRTDQMGEITFTATREGFRLTSPARAEQGAPVQDRQGVSLNHLLPAGREKVGEREANRDEGAWKHHSFEKS